MVQQLTSIAIGNPTVGGFVLGGANVATSFTLTDWAPSVSRNQISISADFYIQADDVGSFSTLIAASRELSSGSASLGISTKPAAKTITVDLTVSSQAVTLTRTAGDSFASTDVAMPINIDDVGSFMITEYVSASVVRCLIAPSLTAPSADTGLTATIGTEFLRIDEAAKVTGFRSDVNIRENPDDDADETRKSYTLDATWERPGNDSRGSSFAHRREASYRVLESPSELKTVEFSGTYTAGSGALAYANYKSAVNGWVNDILSSISSNSFMVVGQDFYGTDDEGSLLTFNLTRKEINIDESAAGADHDAIENAQMRISFFRDNAHGLRGHNSPGTATVEYSANIKTSEATEAQISTLYYGTIRGYLKSVLESVYGSFAVIESEVGPNIDLTENTLEASLSAIITSSGSSIVDYTKNVEYTFNYQKVYRKLHDGKDHTYHIWTPGSVLKAVVTVQVVKIGGITQRGTTSGGVRIGTGGSLGGALSITFGRPGGSSTGGDSVQEQFTEYPLPSPNPSDILGIDQLPPGYWDPGAIVARKTPKFMGRTGDTSEDIEVATYMQPFTWVVNSSVKVAVKPAQGRPVTGSEAGAISTEAGSSSGGSSGSPIRTVERMP